MATNLMFGLQATSWATTARPGAGLVAGEAVATGGLLVVIFALVRTGRADAVPAAVAAWITGAIYFTSSASFANPAVALARTLTDTYTGIAPASVPGFLAGETLGTVAATALVGWLYRPAGEQTREPAGPPAATAATITVPPGEPR